MSQCRLERRGSARHAEWMARVKSGEYQRYYERKLRQPLIQCKPAKSRLARRIYEFKKATQGPFAVDCE